MSEFTYFSCSASDMEEAWIQSLTQIEEERQAQYERDEDFDCEAELAREHVFDEEDASTWPWYADAPSEEAEHEVFDELPPGLIAESADTSDPEVPIEMEDDYLGADHD